MGFGGALGVVSAAACRKVGLRFEPQPKPCMGDSLSPSDEENREVLLIIREGILKMQKNIPKNHEDCVARSEGADGGVQRVHASRQGPPLTQGLEGGGHRPGYRGERIEQGNTRPRVFCCAAYFKRWMFKLICDTLTHTEIPTFPPFLDDSYKRQQMKVYLGLFYERTSLYFHMS
jgi:hypothetical protein